MKILVTGGTGYIGSHTVVELVETGHEVVIVDNLSNSNRRVLNRLKQILHKDIAFHELDVADPKALEKVFEEYNFDAVIHFAGLKAVGESVTMPLQYYRNNIDSTLTLCEVMDKHSVRQLVFSSSAATYGKPESVPIPEDAPLHATNPYGQTKVMIEQILRDLVVSNPKWQITLLRYFNPVGAHKSGLIGEEPSGTPNNLVPYIAQVAVGRRDKVQVFGNDYDTPDGTGVRDYLHVVDLAQGHLDSINHPPKPGHVATYNLGTGRGYSVFEVISSFERACGHKINYEVVGRRPGDVAECFADPRLAAVELQWRAKKTLNEMCEDAWRWQSMNPNGFAEEPLSAKP